MAVYRHMEVDIPKERVTIEKQGNGKTALIKYVLAAPYDREKGYARPKRTTIGHQCIGSTTKMHPTTQYAEIFPSLREKLSNEHSIAGISVSISSGTAISYDWTGVVKPSGLFHAYPQSIVLTLYLKYESFVGLVECKRA